MCVSQSPREFYAVYAEGPDPRYDPLAVVWGQYKAHFYTKGSGECHAITPVLGSPKYTISFISK